MKSTRIFSGLAALAAVLFSCTPDALDPLTGKYPEAVQCDLTSAEVVTIEKGADYRNIVVDFSNGSDRLTLEFVCKTWYLASTTYSPMHADALKSGGYSMEGSSFNGKKLADKGIVMVSGETPDYSLKGTIWVEDGSVYNISWQGALEFEPDPEPVKLSKVLSATNNNTNGTASLTLNLASANVSSSFDATTRTTTYTGSGNFLALDIYSADGKLHPGTYTASAEGGQIGEGQFGIGWDPGDIWNIGMAFTNWGTCWWTVDEGATSAQHLNAGEIEVALKGSTYTITYKEPGKSDKDAIWFEFKGAIEGFVPEAQGPVVVEYLDGVETVGPGMSGENEQISDKHTISVSKGETILATFDFYTEIGAASVAGTYEVMSNSAEAGVAGDGWDASAWGFGMGGAIIWVEGEEYLVRGGHITVTDEDGILTIAAEDDILITLTDYQTEAPVQTFCFENIAFGEIPGGNDTPADTFDGEELNTFIFGADYSTFGGSITLMLGDGNVSLSETQEWSGTGNYLAIDIKSLEPGTYTACATGGVIGDGEFGIGYDQEWVWGEMSGVNYDYGTCWWTVTDGERSAEKVLDGTITVALDGETYTITLESSVVNARYVGPVTL